jgi:hypothetical protein
MAVADEPTGKLKIVIMNTYRNTLDASICNKAEKRRQVISDVVKKSGATLFLFQEFMWTGISGSVWEGKLPSHLEYIGNGNTCILFDENKVTVEEVPDKTGMQSSTLERMCIRKVKTKGVPIVEFICISWHGKSRETNEIRIEELKSMLKDISKLSNKLSLPVLLAGDFNLNAGDIVKQLSLISSLRLFLYGYKPAKRRKSENIIDFFISSESLKMSGIKVLALESITEVAEVLSLFDHDPVVSFMSTKPENKDSLTSYMMSNLSISTLTSDTDTTSSEISAEVED